MGEKGIPPLSFRDSVAGRLRELADGLASGLYETDWLVTRLLAELERVSGEVVRPAEEGSAHGRPRFLDAIVGGGVGLCPRCALPHLQGTRCGGPPNAPDLLRDPRAAKAVEKGCQCPGHHPTCDCDGEGGDR